MVRPFTKEMEEEWNKAPYEHRSWIGCLAWQEGVYWGEVDHVCPKCGIIKADYMNVPNHILVNKLNITCDKKTIKAKEKQDKEETKANNILLKKASIILNCSSDLYAVWNRLKARYPLHKIDIADNWDNWTVRFDTGNKVVCSTNRLEYLAKLDTIEKLLNL
jgi:hypothetical protein